MVTGLVTESVLKRLQLKEGKLQSAVAGIRQIAEAEEPIGKTVSKLEITKGLFLEKLTVPIGVLLIVFEVDTQISEPFPNDVTCDVVCSPVRKCCCRSRRWP